MGKFKRRKKSLHTMKEICEMNGVAYDETKPSSSDDLLKLLGVSSEDELKSLMFGDLYISGGKIMFKWLEKIVGRLRKSNITDERSYAEVCKSISEAAYKNDAVWNSIKEDIDIAAKNGKFKYVIEDIESSKEADRTAEMLNLKGFTTNVRKFNIPDDTELYHITVSW